MDSMTNEAETVSTLPARRAAYELLARLWLAPPDADLAATLRHLPGFAEHAPGDAPEVCGARRQFGLGRTRPPPGVALPPQEVCGKAGQRRDRTGGGLEHAGHRNRTHAGLLGRARQRRKREQHTGDDRLHASWRSNRCAGKRIGSACRRRPTSRSSTR